MGEVTNHSPAESYLSAARILLQKGSSEACISWLLELRDAPAKEMIPALNLLIAPPDGVIGRFRYGSAQWANVRMEALQTLSKTGGQDIFSSLVTSLLCDPSPRVRAKALDLLRERGPECLPEVVQQMQSAKDWRADSMITVINLLGDLGQERPSLAGPVLTRVLFGDLPTAPARWQKRPAQFAARFSAVGTLFTFLWAFFYPPWHPLAPWSLSLIPFVSYLIFYCLAALFAVPRDWKLTTAERRRLSDVAASSLCAIQDSNAVPSVLEAAFGWGHYPGRQAARRIIGSLLPLLKHQQHRENLSFSLRSEDNLLSGLAHASEDTYLAEKIFAALERVGSGRAFEKTERWVHHHHSLLAQNPELSQEAERVLEILQQRLQQKQAPGLLLRASDQPPAASGQLLRPAAYTENTEHEQLLRAGGPYPEE